MEPVVPSDPPGRDPVRPLPGYGHRAFEGDVFAAADAAASRDLWAPWLRVRVLAAAGLVDWLDEDRPGVTLELVPGAPTTPGRWKASAGAGLGLFWDIGRVDAWRPLGSHDGEWQLLLSVNPALNSIL